MSTQYPGVSWQTIKDAGVRAAFKDLDRWLTGIFRNLVAQLSTDPKTGRLRLRAAIVLPDIGHNPTVVTTSGEAGEMVRFGTRIFTRGAEGPVLDDTKDWMEVPTGGTVPSTRRVDAGSGLSGGGDLSIDRIISADPGQVMFIPEVRVDAVVLWPAGSYTGQVKYLDLGGNTGLREHHWMRASDGTAPGTSEQWVQVVRAGV